MRPTRDLEPDKVKSSLNQDQYRLQADIGKVHCQQMAAAVYAVSAAMIGGYIFKANSRNCASQGLWRYMRETDEELEEKG